MFNFGFGSKKSPSHAGVKQNEEENAEIVEIEEPESSTASSIKEKDSKVKTQRSTPALLSSKASSVARRRNLLAYVSKLFMKEWNTANTFKDEANRDNDNTIKYEEWGEYGNLKTIRNKEAFYEMRLDADQVDIWFTESPLWRRFLFRLLAILILFLIAHIIGLLLTLFYFDFKSYDAFVCDTKLCQKTSKWLKSSINNEVEPCENFYEFMCGNYDERTEAEDSFDEQYGDFLFFRSIRSDIQERLIFGEIFRNTTDSYIFHQVRLVFQSCLNYTARDEVGISGFVQTLNDIGLNPDNSSGDINHMAFDIWRYTGQIGFFYLKLYVNPYDSLRKYVTYYNLDEFHDHVFKKGFDAYMFVFQEIIRVMKITKYSDQELARAYQRILEAIFRAKDAIKEKEEDPSLWEKNPEPFLCDTFTNTLDKGVGKISTETFWLKNVVPMNSGQFKQFSFAKFICNGGLNYILQEKDAKYPQIDAKLSYKVFWIMWMFYSYYPNLNPAFKRRFERSDVFPRAKTAPRGAECLRAIENTLPHLLHERLMMTYGVTNLETSDIEYFYSVTKMLFHNWLHDEKRRMTYGNATLKLYRETIDFTFGLLNFRFSLSQLEKYGYGESAKKISKNDFLSNVQLLMQVLSDNELKKWRLEKGYFLPVGYHNFKFIIKEIVATEYQMRPNLHHQSLMPALLYTSLYLNEDLLPLLYGGVQSFIAADIIYRWRYYAWDREDAEEIDLDPVDMQNCVVHKNSGKKIMRSYEHHQEYFPFEMIFDLLIRQFSLEKYIRDQQPIFAFKKLIGFEKYSEEQLVFMKVLRHQCASVITNMDEVLTGLSNSRAFQDFWKCPVNSSMYLNQPCNSPRTKLERVNS